MLIKLRSQNPIFRIGLALLFSMVICSVPWAQLRGVPFEDLDVYLDKFLIGDMLIENPDSDFGFVWYFTNEVLWDFLIRYGVDSLGFSVEDTLTAISAISIFCFALVVLSRESWWAVFILVNPLVIDFSMSQVRMALAVSVLFLALAIRNRLIVSILVVSTLLIHSASVLFVLFYVLIKYLPYCLEKIGVYFSLKLMAIVIGLSTCMVIGPLREVVLGYFGDRRAEYNQVPSSSFAYALFWILFLTVMLFQRNKYFDCGFFQSQRNIGRRWFESSGSGLIVSSSQWPVKSLSLVCLTIFAFGTVFNIPVIRFVSASFPLLVISFLEINGTAKILLLPAGIGFVAMQWWYWLS